MVYGARNYVVPSQELRPLTLEAAKAAMVGRRIQHAVLGAIATIVLVLILSIPVLNQLQRLPVPTGPTASDMHQHAANIASDPAVGSQWAMAEAFTRLRIAQSTSQRWADL